MRLQSLDIFRGATIALMILVNSPGSWNDIYSPFKHAQWNGCTPTDLVFPFFLFIVGVSITFSLNSVANSTLTPALMSKFVKRGAALFVIGLFLNVIPAFEFSTIRIPGVLQRIALVFVFCATLFVTTSAKTQLFVGCALLILYWVLLTFIPINGQLPSELIPGDNLAAYIDSFVLKGHMWSVTNTWDPEGLLSTLPATCSTLAGILTTTYLKKHSFGNTAILKTIAAGVATLGLGLLWSPYFPINKSLWTSSYVLFTSGIAAVCFCLLYWVVDRKQGLPLFIKQPFMVFGTNAITAYVLSGVLTVALYNVQISDQSIQHHYYQFILSIIHNTHASSLICATLFTSLIYLVALILYRKNIFIKI
jgi:predicted acyltransferase